MASRKQQKKPRPFLKWLSYALVASIIYVFIGKIILPPITITQLTSLVQGYGLQRDYVSWDELSPNIRLAVIASEDQLFPTHHGFDWYAIQNSIDGKRTKKQKSLGVAASTISQQTAKNVFLWQGSGWTRYLRKAPEFIYTWLIELVWGKRRILHVYCNVIETGKGVFGMEAAAQKYFHKSAENLSKNEAAMLVASLPNPKVFTVVPMSKRVAWRYPQIVRQMNNIASMPEVIAVIK